MDDILSLFTEANSATAVQRGSHMVRVFTAAEARIAARVLSHSEVSMAADIAAAGSLCRPAITGASARVLRIAASL